LVEVVFGNNHYTVINMNNVNFTELLDEKEWSSKGVWALTAPLFFFSRKLQVY
jgi:hypothetical protein